MLTPFVTALVFANVMATTYALPWAAFLGVASLTNEKKTPPRLLTHEEPTPTRFPGQAGEAGRPYDIAKLSKEEFHELPSAA
jgi:hypothetical protein